jgi:hypothetical protein
MIPSKPFAAFVHECSLCASAWCSPYIAHAVTVRWRTENKKIVFHSRDAYTGLTWATLLLFTPLMLSNGNGSMKRPYQSLTPQNYSNGLP